MADEAPSLFSWLRSQVQRGPKGDGDGTPGTGGGLRLSRGMWIAVALAIVVVIVVLTSGNGGTPSSNAADSGSPSPGSSASGGDPGSAPPDTQANRAPGASGTGPVASADATKHAASGKTAYTRHPRGLIVRSEPANTASTVVTLEYDHELTLICYAIGPKVYGRNGLASELWDKVTTPGGKTGYVPDSWVLTEAEVTELVPAC